jgi:hypothetical protein
MQVAFRKDVAPFAGFSLVSLEHSEESVVRKKRHEAIATRSEVLFLSGYTHLGARGNRPVETSISFLQKPFTRAALAQRVRRILDSQS